MAAKRSPILGYNHNVRYRGLVFHVQTEDSGVMSPHLFTHMFHGGVIVSTRKLVYDSGSAEDSIKSLMQAQHKAVLKDLKRGSFDDKIDQYLGGTEGLLPRGAVEEERASQAIEPLSELDSAPVAAVAVAVASMRDVPSMPDIEIIPSPDPDPEPELEAAPAPPMEPPPPMDDLPTVLDSQREIAGAVLVMPRTHTDSTPEIEIRLDVDDEGDTPAAPPPRPHTQSSAPSIPRRASRDTEVKPFEPPSATPTAIAAHTSGALSDGIPRSAPHLASGRSTIPGLAPADPDTRTRPTESVSPTAHAPDSKRIGAASLPPMRQPTRPPSRPAIVAPTVVSRPLTRDDSRDRHDSDAIEVYAPPPASAQDPPGVQPERPGQYSLRRSQKFAAPVPPPVEAPPTIRPRERSGAAAIPSGLARPGRSGPVRTSTAPPGEPPPLPASARADAPLFSQTQGAPKVRPPEPAAPPPPVARPVPRSGPQPAVMPERARTATPAQFEGTRPRTPTPARVVPPTSRTASSSSSGVVMTRPAVIVGAPAKPPPPRVRKASEESRGFGQGLISEKSLDEVILAYLSEDAEDK